MLKSLSIATLVASGVLCAMPASANDWGCEVLLCVSGDWRGTPSCHPPMYKLIAAMKVPGFSWPICPSANSSAAKYDQYDDCPAGWTIGYTDTGHDGSRSAPNLCQKPNTDCQRWDGRDGNSCGLYVSMPRPLRQKPWHIEYNDASGLRQKAWFNLQK